MNWSTSVSLKQKGYTFHKLYAKNYKVYQKDLGNENFNIWCWVANKKIEIGSFYNMSEKFFNFVKENKAKLFKADGETDPKLIFCVLKYNKEFFDEEELEKSFLENCEFREGYRNYQKYCQDNNLREVIITLEIFEKLEKEIEFLTKP